MAEDETIFGRMPTPYWLAKGRPKVFLPYRQCEKEVRKDLALAKRIRKPGQRIENLGAFSNTYTVVMQFHNGGEHPEAQGRYPDDAEELEKSLTVDDRGELYLPFYGAPFDAQLENYKRVEVSEQRDYCEIHAVFVADWADSEQQLRFSTPTSASVAGNYVAAVVAAGLEAGVDLDPIGEFQDFAAELEGLANAPADFVGSVEGKITRATAACDRVMDTFSQRASEARSEVYSLFTSPAESKLGRQMKKLQDMFGRVRGEVGAGQIVTKTYHNPVSIFAVASAEKQDVQKIIPINAHIGNLMAIPPGTPVRMFSQGTS